jgi:hypothetical protein
MEEPVKNTQPRNNTPKRWTIPLTLLLAVILTLPHILYSFAGGLFLYQQSDGIHTQGKWTEYGGARYAWAIPLELPGSLLLADGDKIYRPRNQNDGGQRVLGMLLVLAGSAVTSLALASVLVGIFARKDFSFGRYKWKAVIIILGLIWIPVPEKVAWVYQYTVIY